MKHFLKLVALSFMLFGAMSLSQSALACTQNDPNYHACMHHNILNQPQGSYSGGGSSGVISNYLGLAWTKDGEPFFVKRTIRTNYGFMDAHWEEYDAITINECNKSSHRRPCRLANSLVNGCIALAKSDKISDVGVPELYFYPDAKCKIAKQNVIKSCQAQASNPSSCKIYKTKHS